MVKFRNIYLLFAISTCIILLESNMLYSQNNNDIINLDSILFNRDFFENEEIIELNLEFDITKFKKEKSDSIYLPATLKFHDIKNNLIEKKVRIRSRGIFRNQHCSFPPIMLNVKNADLTDGVYKGENKYKIVTHCKASKQYENYLFKEYIAYKIWNILSDYSFKLRLTKINYINTSKGNDVFTDLAFIIEPEDVLAERLKTYPLKRDNMRYSQADSINTTIMSIFQYMIGNTDYSIGGRHNVKLLVSKDHTKPGFIPVPYDFDFSGLVNAYYARPNPDLPIKSVRERLYYGMCRSDELYYDVIDIFIEKEEEILELIYSFDLWDKKTGKLTAKYINEFYDEIKKTKFIDNRIRISCDN